MDHNHIGRSSATLRYGAEMAEDLFSGTLADLPLDAVLASLAQHSRTGVLRVGNTTPSSDIWLSEGRLYYIEKPGGNEPVAVLFGGGLGSIEEIEGLLQRGDAAAGLAAGGDDDTSALGRLLHEHNLNLLFELLVPSQATFSFEPDLVHPVGDHFGEDISELVHQAKRRLEIWAEIASSIPNTGAIFTLSNQLPDGADERLVTADEWRYLSLLDGRRTVADVISSTQMSAFRVVSALYRMLLEGLVEESARDSAA